MTSGVAPEAPRSLINPHGGSFTDELSQVEPLLDALPNVERKRYRDRNADDIATHSSSRLLVVAGPGSGKSFLFLARIKHWLSLHPDASIYVASFVRKLVTDLRTDIEHKADLDPTDQARVTVTTLHTLARSLLERNRGTSARPLGEHIKVIVQEWQPVIWRDVLQFHSNLSASAFTHKLFAHQLYTEGYETQKEWHEIRSTYALLSGFYNAVGFPDMIVLARDAIDENPQLNEHLLWIIDEYQDFNPAEDRLIQAVTATARGVLIAGDDEQALYQELKASLPEIICSYYAGKDYANAMLPYSSRCSYYACLAASAFISKHRSDSAIAKVYLPLVRDKTAQKVQVVAAPAPVSAVDYIGKFIDDRHAEIEEHRMQMEAGEETDPFLLILTPKGSASFYQNRGADGQLRTLVGAWSNSPRDPSPDYRRVADYCAMARDSADNFAVRKVLHYENASVEEIHSFIVAALDRGCNLADVLADSYASMKDTCAAVADVVDDESSSATEKAEDVANLISISNSIAVGVQNPICPI